MIALAIGAMLAIAAFQAFYSAQKAETSVKQTMDNVNDMVRVWQFLGDDLQHAVARQWKDSLGSEQPAMRGLLGDRLSQSAATAILDDSALLRFMRHGNINFFEQAQSDLMIVAYRLVAEEDSADEPLLSLWRDYWHPVDAVQEPVVRSRLLFQNISAMRMRYLAADSQSTEDQAWITGWDSSENGQLPIAVEVTIETGSLGEIVRLFALSQQNPAE